MLRTDVVESSRASHLLPVPPYEDFRRAKKYRSGVDSQIRILYLNGSDDRAGFVIIICLQA